MTSESPTDLTAVEGVRAIREGRLTAEQWVGACLARIDEIEDNIQAWQHLDPDLALAQARAADQLQSRGKPLGPLHGVPIAIKDIFDTRDMPTEYGSPIHAGHRPAEDAAVVARLREAGAVIVGKTVTTEFALFSPGKTRNPHDNARTPGGSSSGSAAAVACNMVPLALGSQTAGSVIRPASFCGVFGYKPSHGLISRYGALPLSPMLDHVGAFARNLDGLVLVSRVLIGADPRDADTHDTVVPDFERRESRGDLRFAFLRSPAWERVDADAVSRIEDFVVALGTTAVEVDPPAEFADILESHRIVMERDVALYRDRDFTTSPDQFSARLTDIIERGRNIDQATFDRALQSREQLRRQLDDWLLDFDAIVTVSSSGEAPLGLDATGDPSFAVPWTFLGMPAISLPMLAGANRLPIGIQLVGRFGRDGELIDAARRLVENAAARLTTT